MRSKAEKFSNVLLLNLARPRAVSLPDALRDGCFAVLNMEQTPRILLRSETPHFRRHMLDNARFGKRASNLFLEESGQINEFKLAVLGNLDLRTEEHARNLLLFAGESPFNLKFPDSPDRFLRSLAQLPWK